MKVLRPLAFRLVVVFVALFIITLPFPYHLLPSVGEYLRPWSEPLARWVGDHLLHLEGPYTAAIVSDSTGMYLHTMVLLLIAIMIAVAWSVLKRRGSHHATSIHLFDSAISYYLALQLFKYGLDKLFKSQFYLPEPNTLYTPLGHLSRDILYWSTMGASYRYTLFTGLLEIIPAILLLFRRTRVLGGMVATAVVAHIVMTNLGFDISVKLYSCFLLLLCILIARPGWTRFFRLFILNRSVDGVPAPPNFRSEKTMMLHSVAKALVIVVILFEGLFPYFKADNFDDDTAPRPFLHGAYDVRPSMTAAALVAGSGTLKRFFIHRRGYFITQSTNDEMRDHRLEYDLAHHRLILDAHSDSAIALDYRLSENDSTLTLSRAGDSTTISARRIDLKDLPLLSPSFHWTIDGYR